MYPQARSHKHIPPLTHTHLHWQVVPQKSPDTLIHLPTLRMYPHQLVPHPISTQLVPAHTDRHRSTSKEPLWLSLCWVCSSYIFTSTHVLYLRALNTDEMTLDWQSTTPWMTPLTMNICAYFSMLMYVCISASASEKLWCRADHAHLYMKKGGCTLKTCSLSLHSQQNPLHISPTVLGLWWTIEWH